MRSDIFCADAPTMTEAVVADVAVVAVAADDDDIWNNQCMYIYIYMLRDAEDGYNVRCTTHTRHIPSITHIDTTRVWKVMML